MSMQSFYLVWNPETGKAVHRHETEGDAVSEAERLAKHNPGSEFYVLRAVEYRCVGGMSRVTLTSPEDMPF